MLNKIILIGRLVRDPELRYTGGGTAVCKFTLAVGRSFTNQQGEREADFIDVITWKNQAEVVANHLSKGRLVAVEGRLQIRSYDDNQGIRRKAAEIVANAVTFLDFPKNQQNQNYHNQSYQEQDYQHQGNQNHGYQEHNYQNQGYQEQGTPPPNNGMPYNGGDFGSEISFNDEDLPF